MIRFLFLSIALFSSFYSFAIERIDITQGKIEPTPIAHVKFSGPNSMDKEFGKEITSIINNDLQGTGLFRVINEAAYIEQITNIRNRPKFSTWRQINASILLAGEVFKVGNSIKVEYRLWDPYTEKSLKSGFYYSNESDWRRIAHKIADDIYKRITGEAGYFDTKILFIAASGPPQRRIKKLAIMDQDGANLKYLSNGKNLTLTPRFSPDNSKALYLSYIGYNARVHLRDIDNSKDRVLGQFKGMTFAPRFSPDGEEVAMSAARKGSSDVFLMNLSSKTSKQLTRGAYINTSPYFSPNGKKIAFVSDRSGTAQIYIMNKDGSDQERITFGKGRYYTPAWSPRGDFIAFTRSYKGTFYIGVIRPDGSGERMLTDGYLVESPAWAPNGRVIMYSRGEKYRGDGKASRSVLCTIDLTGNFERTLLLPTDATDPSWSNLLN